MKKSAFVNMVRIPSVLSLIALEFTSLVQFLAEGGATAHTIQHSRYPVYFAAYGICALIVAIDPKSAKRFFEKPLVLWAFAALMLFTWGMLVRTLNAPAGIEDYFFFREFGLRVNAVGFLLCCTMIVDDPNALRITKWAVAVATLVGVALNIYDFMFPGFFSVDPGRAAGFYKDPNASGIALVLGCVIGLSAMRRDWWKEAFALVVLIGVLVTFSRESVLAWGCVALVGCLGGRLSLGRLAIAGSVGVAFLVVFNMGNGFLDQKIGSNEEWTRLTSHSDDSTTQRLDAAKQTLDAFEEAPLLGNGFGTASYWTEIQGPHNFFLNLLADHGIIGIFLIPALLLSIGRKCWDFYAFAVAFLVFCAFSHNVFDAPWGLIGLAIVAAERPRQVVYGPKFTSLLCGQT